MKRPYQLRVWANGKTKIRSFSNPTMRYIEGDKARTDGLKVEQRDAPTAKWRTWRPS